MNAVIDLERQTFQDYDQVQGKVLLVREVVAFIDDTHEQGEFYFDPPLAVRVLSQDLPSLINYQDGYVDPYWHVEVVRQYHPQLTCQLRSAYIYGTSYNAATGEPARFRGTVETRFQAIKRWFNFLRKRLADSCV